MSIPLYIFDLDGTLALTEHRQHILDDIDNPDRWSAFFRACVDDKPNWPVIDTFNAVLRAGAQVQIWSGRSAQVMNETLAWIQRFVKDDIDADEIELVMRREGDFTSDEVLKQQWLNSLNEYDRRRLVAVFDDRDKVVRMWRENGVACFQVAPGNF